MITVSTSSLLRLLLKSLPTTLSVYAGAVVLGTALAVVVSVLGVSQLRAFRLLSAFYAWIFRGIPELVILFFIFYGVPTFGPDLSPTTSAILGLGAVAGAYEGEIFRAAILSVDRTQFEAAQALALPRVRYWRRVIAPQAFRSAIPPLLSYNMSLVKATSLASVITVHELMGTSNRLIASTFEPFVILGLVAAIYFVLVTVMYALQAFLEMHFKLKT